MAKTKNIKELSIPVELGGMLNCLFKNVMVQEPEASVPNMNHEPAVDMFSTAENVIIEVELPGVRKEDIEIDLLRSVLTIKGLKYECFNDKRVNFVCMERSFGKFCKIIELMHPVDTTRIKAVYKNGMLTITLPKVRDRRGVPNKIPVE